MGIVTNAALMQNTEPEQWILGKGLEDWEKVEGGWWRKEGQP
jgi:hypothetical protein